MTQLVLHNLIPLNSTQFLQTCFFCSSYVFNFDKCIFFCETEQMHFRQHSKLNLLVLAARQRRHINQILQVCALSFAKFKDIFYSEKTTKQLSLRRDM
jgi:hypothetical protein